MGAGRGVGEERAAEGLGAEVTVVETMGAMGEAARVLGRLAGVTELARAAEAEAVQGAGEEEEEEEEEVGETAGKGGCPEPLQAEEADEAVAVGGKVMG